MARAGGRPTALPAALLPTKVKRAERIHSKANHTQRGLCSPGWHRIRKWSSSFGSPPLRFGSIRPIGPFLSPGFCFLAMLHAQASGLNQPLGENPSLASFASEQCLGFCFQKSARGKTRRGNPCPSQYAKIPAPNQHPAFEEGSKPLVQLVKKRP